MIRSHRRCNRRSKYLWEEEKIQIYACVGKKTEFKKKELFSNKNHREKTEIHLVHKLCFWWCDEGKYFFFQFVYEIIWRFSVKSNKHQVYMYIKWLIYITSCQSICFICKSSAFSLLSSNSFIFILCRYSVM